MMLRDIACIQAPEEFLAQVTKEVEFLEGTSKGDQVVSALKLLLKNRPDQISPEERDILVDQLCWAYQMALKNATATDMVVLLRHDPDLGFLRGFLTLQPLAEETGLTLRLYAAKAVLAKPGPDGGPSAMQASLDYSDGGLAAALTFVKAEAQQLRAAKAKIVGAHRDGANTSVSEESAVGSVLARMQKDTSESVALLKAGHQPELTLHAPATTVPTAAPAAPQFDGPLQPGEDDILPETRRTHARTH